jgi:hypothetical protein
MYKTALSLALVTALTTSFSSDSLLAQNPQPPQVQIPQPGVPEALTIEGSFVRGAYNNEAYAIIGYRLANSSVGEEWMLLEFGTTVLDNTPAYTMKREHLSLETPDGKTPRCRPSRSIARLTQGLINRRR